MDKIIIRLNSEPSTYTCNNCGQEVTTIFDCPDAVDADYFAVCDNCGQLTSDKCTKTTPDNLES